METRWPWGRSAPVRPRLWWDTSSADVSTAVPGQTVSLGKGVHPLDYVTPPVLVTPDPWSTPDGYRRGRPSILCRFRCKSADKIFLLVATAVPQRPTEVLQNGRTTTPDLAGQPADVQQGWRLAPPVPMCWVPFSSKTIPRSIRCSCGFFFF